MKKVNEDAALVKNVDSSSQLLSIRQMFQLPGARNYIFTGLAALIMVFLVMFQRGSDLGGLFVVVIAAAGLILRWSSAPLFFLIFIIYFLVFPYGFPPADENRFEIEEGHFRITDIFLTGSILVYLLSNYRLFAITQFAVPIAVKKASVNDRRPDELIRPGEIQAMLIMVVIAVVAGQLLWMGITDIEIIPTEEFPFQFSTTRIGMPPNPESLHPVLSRLLILVGLLFFGTLLARLIFGYWRLRAMTPLEAGMLLQEIDWNENRRDRVRIEAWRKWAKEQIKLLRTKKKKNKD